MKRVFLLPFVFVAGCQSNPVVKERVKEVSVPVAMLPIKAEQIPTPPAPLGPRPSSDRAASDLLLAKVCEFVAYVISAEPLLRVSAGVGQVPLSRYPECESK